MISNKVDDDVMPWVLDGMSSDGESDDEGDGKKPKSEPTSKSKKKKKKPLASSSV